MRPKCDGYTKPEGANKGVIHPEYPLRTSTCGNCKGIDHSGRDAHLAGAQSWWLTTARPSLHGWWASAQPSGAPRLVAARGYYLSTHWCRPRAATQSESTIAASVPISLARDRDGLRRHDRTLLVDGLRRSQIEPPSWLPRVDTTWVSTEAIRVRRLKANRLQRPWRQSLWSGGGASWYLLSNKSPSVQKNPSLWQSARSLAGPPNENQKIATSGRFYMCSSCLKILLVFRHGADPVCGPQIPLFALSHSQPMQYEGIAIVSKRRKDAFNVNFVTITGT